ncbi:MAG TPA: sulfite exporter TauE/SafE family protein [Flavipsychrobacter sp.]
MEIVGYIAALLVGLSLGLVGGGGAILTVPLLVYLFGVEPSLATGYSLFIVGIAALTGAVKNYRKGNVDLQTTLLFGITSVLTVIATRRLLLPAIPRHIGYIGGMEITNNLLTMLLFAVLMLWASVSMIRGKKVEADSEEQRSIVLLLLYGVGIGLVTGLLGAGGGFLLIPALVFFARLEMKTAIGTSLSIIAMNSLIGFASDVWFMDIDWVLLLSVSGLAVAGIFAGMRLGKNIPGKSLQKGFGWFVLITGVYILIKELL